MAFNSLCWSSNLFFASVIAFCCFLCCFKSSETIRASCEDYRAGATIDIKHHNIDRHKKINSPLLILWGKQGTVEELYDPIEVWKCGANNVEGESIDCGHFLPEEKPRETYSKIIEFIES